MRGGADCGILPGGYGRPDHAGDVQGAVNPGSGRRDQFRSRSAGGVKVFDTGKKEVVVSVAWIADQGEGDTDGDDTGEAES